jgi:hypothetical protein
VLFPFAAAPLDGRVVAPPADDQLRLRAEERITRDALAAFDRFQKEGVARLARDAHERADGRLQVGQNRPHDGDDVAARGLLLELLEGWRLEVNHASTRRENDEIRVCVRDCFKISARVKIVGAGLVPARLVSPVERAADLPCPYSLAARPYPSAGSRAYSSRWPQLTQRRALILYLALPPNLRPDQKLVCGRPSTHAEGPSP